MSDRIAIFVESADHRSHAEMLAERLRTTAASPDVLLVGPDEERAPDDWLVAESVGRVVLFDDRTARGRDLVAAASGCPVVLLQARQLDLLRRAADPSVRDRAWGWGGAGVDAIAVWGPAAQRAVAQRDALPTCPVTITGALGISDHRDFAARFDAEEPHRRTGDGPLRVLLVDEPLGDDFGVPPTVHRRLITNVAKAVPDGGTLTVAVDPRSDAAHRHWLDKGFAGRTTSLPEVSDDLRRFDVIVTFTSGVYLDALTSGIPVIFYGAPDLPAVVPKLRHVLVGNVTTANNLGGTLRRLQEIGEFRSNRFGTRLQEQVIVNESVLDDVLRVILEAEPAVALEQGAAAEQDVAAEQAEETQSAPVARLEFPSGSLAIVADNFSSSTGVAVPLLAVVDGLTEREKHRVRLVDVRAYDRAEDLTRELSRSPVIVVNSLGPFWRNGPLLESVKELLEGGKHVVIVYAHVTGWVIDRHREKAPERHADVLELFGKLHFWCVSDRQADLLAGLGARSTTTVLNTTFGLPERVSGSAGGTGERRLVVMAGTVQERKGPALFGAVADLAAAQGLPYDFAWVGHDHKHLRQGIDLSENVQWLGHLPREELQQILRGGDVFLLSSQDDPMPLVALEAVGVGMRVVSYDRVGTWEALDGIDGYVAFETYEPEAALKAVVRALETPVDAAAYQGVLDTFSVEALRTRMARSLVTLDPVSLDAAANEARGRGPDALGGVLELAATSDETSAAYWLALSRQALRAPLALRPIGVAAARRALELDPRSRAAKRLLRRHHVVPATARQAVANVGNLGRGPRHG